VRRSSSSTISTTVTTKNAITPNSRKPAQAMPSNTQNSIRSAIGLTPLSSAAPKMSTTVSARPMVPENSGV